MKKLHLALWLCAVPVLLQAQDISLKNDCISRTLSFDGHVWRTTAFTDLRQHIRLKVKSEELNILPMNTDTTYSIADFTAIKTPVTYSKQDTSFIEITYKPLKANAALPEELLIQYYVVKGEAYSRKKIILHYQQPATVDRLETERFVLTAPATGGGRGEPVFADARWFFGLEYPASYTRHSDGNTPASYARYYDKVGNYSFIDLEGRDVEPAAVKGMLRLMHFPGYAVAEGNSGYYIHSKTAVVGCREENRSVEQSFLQYLTTMWKAPRSFLHYNNWFEPRAKDLSGDGLLNIWREFKTAIAPYGIKMDAMVADDGWQQRKSIWDPATRYFPNGLADMKKLSARLKSEGTGFGLWLAINDYTNDITWARQQGYKEAIPNSYFKQYGRYLSLSATQNKTKLLQQIPEIVRQTNAIYYKHDFNELSDLSEGNNHPATDRHGHEANLDAAIEILLATRKVNPDIYQNLTNWIWFSPYWLMYADYLWMLSGDDGTNGNWPELSTRATASTDRDTYIWRMFGNPADRPLVPVSRLMTHGIIKTSDGRMESKDDTLQDWLEYVLMHYGRGTLLKEWYISPEVMSADEWKALCTVDNWAAAHRSALNNTVFVGGRPDEGNAYGYMGWDGDKGLLVARNTQANPQELIIPFDRSVNFPAAFGEKYHANITFPYQDVYPQTFISGKTIRLLLPGYATMALEFKKGKAGSAITSPEKINFNTHGNTTTLQIPADVQGRCELLLTGYPELPAIKINGDTGTVKRRNKAAINQFSSYATIGMPSSKARDWNMVSIDLLPYAGKTVTITYSKTSGFESHLLAERPVAVPAPKEGKGLLWPITNGSRRQTIQLF